MKKCYFIFDHNNPDIHCRRVLGTPRGLLTPATDGQAKLRSSQELTWNY